MAETQDTEISLGTGRLLGLFFGLVILCALFFSVGYSLGHNAGRTETSVSAAAPATLPAPVAVAAGAKPSPARSDTPSTSDELTFYKSVEQNKPKAQLEPAPAPNSNAPTAAEAIQPAKAALEGYTVQVAAVSKQEDAEALVGALRKKQYPVFINSNAGDKLFHVQVGPFSDLKDAESIKARLASDGYNAIVKK